VKYPAANSGILTRGAIRRFAHGKWQISGLKALFLKAICNKGVRCGRDDE